MIRGFSLTQPWASLVSIGAKRWETRSWDTAFRCQIAVHASKKYPADCRMLEYEEPFLSALTRGLGTRAHALPTGAIVALAVIGDCLPTERFACPEPGLDADDATVLISGEEHAFGNYAGGRYAIRLDKVRPLEVPIPCKGALGFWTIPDGVLALIAEQIGVGRPRG